MSKKVFCKELIYKMMKQVKQVVDYFLDKFLILDNNVKTKEGTKMVPSLLFEY